MLQIFMQLWKKTKWEKTIARALFKLGYIYSKGFGEKFLART
jgi:hypothetical protein